MRRQLSKQTGLTFWGLVFVLGTLAVAVLFTLRVFPLYNEKYQMMAIQESLAARPDAKKLSIKQVRKLFLRNIDVTNFTRIHQGNIKDLLTVEKGKKKGERLLHLKYDATNKLVADLELKLVYDHTVPMGGSDTGE